MVEGGTVTTSSLVAVAVVVVVVVVVTADELTSEVRIPDIASESSSPLLL